MQRKVSPLHESSYRGFIDLVQMLIDKGAAIDATDKDGWTPLHAACRQGNIDVVLLLVKANANIGSRSRAGKLPREYAVDQGCTRIVELLDAVSTGRDRERGSTSEELNAYFDSLLGSFSTASPAAGELPAAAKQHKGTTGPQLRPQQAPGSGAGTPRPGAHVAPKNQQLLSDIQRMIQNDATLKDVVWSGLAGVDAAVLCSLADALPANSCVRRLDFTGIKAMNDVIATRIGASVPYCAVQTIILDGTSASKPKQLDLHRLCLMNEVRQVAANHPELTAINWNGRNADDVTVSALANALQGNHRIVTVDLSYNLDVHDRSIRRVADVVSKSAVQQVRMVGTGVTANTTAEVQHLCAMSNVSLITVEGTTAMTALPDMQSLSLGSPVELNAAPKPLRSPFAVEPAVSSSPLIPQSHPADRSPPPSQLSQPATAQSFTQPVAALQPAVGAIGVHSTKGGPAKANSRLFGWVSAASNDRTSPNSSGGGDGGGNGGGDGDSSGDSATAANLWMPDLALQPSLTSPTDPAPWASGTVNGVAIEGGGGAAFGALSLGPTAEAELKQGRTSSSLTDKLDADWPVASGIGQQQSSSLPPEQLSTLAQQQAWEQQQQRRKQLVQDPQPSPTQAQHQQQAQFGTSQFQHNPDSGFQHQPQQTFPQQQPTAATAPAPIPYQAPNRRQQQPKYHTQQQGQQQPQPQPQPQPQYPRHQQPQELHPQHQAGQQRYRQRQQQQQQQRQQQQGQQRQPVQAWGNPSGGGFARGGATGGTGGSGR